MTSVVPRLLAVGAMSMVPLGAFATSASSKNGEVPLPCDLAASAGTPCSAAHSVARLLTNKYAGPLFQIQRAFDSSTLDIFPFTTGTPRIGTADVASTAKFCARTTCSISYIYDQIDLVAPLKGSFGNLTGSISLNPDGTTSLTVPLAGGAGTQTVPITNGFASLALPNSAGSLSVQLSRAPTPTAQTRVQVSIGNDLPAIAGGQQATLHSTSLPSGTLVPNLSTLAGQAYRNRLGTVNQSIGNTEIAEYMVVGAQYDQLSNCCGTYGNMENTSVGSQIGSEVEGEMFALAYSSGNAATFGYSAGYTPGGVNDDNNLAGINWPGVDAEAGVYLYGPQQPSDEEFVTVLAKYSPANAQNLFAVKDGDASQSILTPVFDQAPPPAVNFFTPAGHAFDGQFQGGLSLGEGGDSSPAPIQFFEGAIITKATSDATDNAIQASIAGFYGPPQNSAAASCYADNLINLPLSLSNPSDWSQVSSVGVASAAGISGSSADGATLTQVSGSPIANIDEFIKVQGGQTYTFTDFVRATTNATVFPAGSVQTDDSNNTETAWVLNTNTGNVVMGTWGAGKALTLNATQVGPWWKVSMTFAAATGASHAHVFLDPPTSNAAGVRSQQPAGLSATHYCPGLAISSSLPQNAELNP
jgi:hypothetical protein